MPKVSLIEQGQQDYLLLMLPSEMVSSILEAFSSLVKQLESDTVLIVVTHASSASQIKHCLNEANLHKPYTLVVADNDVSLKMWIQDHLLVGCDNNDGFQLLISQQSEQVFYKVMERIAKAVKLPLHMLDSATEMPDGGNILSWL